MMDNKICSTCKSSLPISEFNWRDKPNGVLQYCCKNCQRAQQRKYYAKHPEYQVKVKADNKRRRRKNKVWFLEYLKQQKCADCGIQDYVVLTHDHRDPALKSDCVSVYVQQGNSLRKIKDEIDKCDVVCFNCHARRTAKTQKWYENWN